MFVGPALNFLTSRVEFTIGTLIVDRYTSPGLLMAILWIAYHIFFIFTYPDELGDCDDKMTECDKATSIDCSQSKQDGLTGLNWVDALRRKRQTFMRYFNEFSEESIIVCYGMFFVLYFLQSNMETSVTPLMDKFFHFDIRGDSLFFVAIAIVAFFACVIVAYLSKRKVDDRLISLIGFILITLSCIFCLIFFPGGSFGQRFLPVYFAFTFFIYVVGDIFITITSMSIYSKLVSEQCMGLAMGMKKSMEIFGMILGPLWASLIDKLYLMYGVNLCLSLFFMSLFVLSYRKMISG